MSKMKRFLSFVLLVLLLASTNGLESVYAQPTKGIQFDEYGIRKGTNITFDVENDGSYNSMMNLSISSLIQWENLTTKYDIPLNKIWTIDFNRSFKFEDIDGIVIEKSGKFIPVKIDLLPTGGQAIITPVDSLLKSEIYTIRVFLNNGKRYKLDFKTVDTESARVIGNHNGNMANNGLVAEYKDWIFYSNKDDGGSLWKMNEDAKENVKLVDGNINSISTIGDGWIYYSKDTKIYKCRYDGTDETYINTFVTTRSNPNSDHFYSFYSHAYRPVIADDEFIYYYNNAYRIRIHTSDKQDFIKGIYKISKNGNSRTFIESDAYIMSIYNGWIYYTTELKDAYKVKTDGTGKISILNTKATNLQVVNDWIYFIDPDLSKIYKTDLNGKNKQQVSPDYGEELHVTKDGWVYYVNNEDRGMYRIRIDGSQRSKMTDNPVSDINVSHGYIYYYDIIEKTWYKMTQEGKNRVLWNN